MRLLASICRIERLLQLRSARFRIAAIGYAVLAAIPACLLFFFFRHATSTAVGPASYLAQTLEIQPFLTVLLVVLVAGNRSSIEAQQQLWPVLAAAPMTNAGYVLRRWLALLTLLVPLSLLPSVLTAALAFASGAESLDPVLWGATWALQILPLVVVLSAFWLAWVTITGGEIAAAITTLVGFPLVVTVVNQLLVGRRLTMSGFDDWLSYRSTFRWIEITLWSMGEDSERLPNFAATEAPYDLTAAASRILPPLLPLLGAAALGLGLSVGFLRRTRRDLPPRPVPPEHQLRTFLEKLNHLRQRYAPDGGLGWRERLMAVLGVVVLVASAAAVLAHQLHFHRLAARRYQAEKEHVWAPLPLAVGPSSWSLHGRIGRGGALEIEAAGRFVNRGAAAAETLVFSLNPALEVARLTVPERRVEQQRAWDRLRLRLDPPLAAGESLDVAFHVTGAPTEIDFYFGWGRGDRAFAKNYKSFLGARFPRDVPDFSRSRARRAVSERRIHLRASDLGPVPRYTRWTWTNPEEGGALGASPWGLDVRTESEPIEVDLELDLAAPPEWFLADTCGHASRIEEGRSRLRGTCRTSLAGLEVAGGALVPARADFGEVVFAALPAHRGESQTQVEALARVAALSERAWPGLPGLDGLVALEWPPEPSVDLRAGMFRWQQPEPELSGRLLYVPEQLMISSEPLAPENLVAQVLARDLLARRAAVPEQEVFFRELFGALMIRRMGLEDGRGATVSGESWVKMFLQTPILGARPDNGYIWKLRFPAVLVELESRVGSETFYAVIESFLSAGATPGTAEELLAELEARSGRSLARMVEDHFQGGALPMLQLEEVRSQHVGGAWKVEGKVRNVGTGEAVCPVIVKTEVGEMKLEVTVGSASASPFAVRTQAKPHTVLLDPQRTCYRFVTKASPTLERANLLGSG